MEPRETSIQVSNTFNKDTAPTVLHSASISFCRVEILIRTLFRLVQPTLMLSYALKGLRWLNHQKSIKRSNLNPKAFNLEP